MKDLSALLLALCNVQGTPGCEAPAAAVAAKFLDFCDTVEYDVLSGLHAFLGNPAASRQIMLDAHIDQIGMTVTEITDAGFLHITNLGGIDRRTLPGSLVTVYGKQELPGVVCSLPPHMHDGNEKIAKTREHVIDLGLPRERVTTLVEVGDRVVLKADVRPLMGTRVAGTALDDRADCAAVLRAAQLLHSQPLSCGVHIVLSSKEEVGGQGAKIQAYQWRPTEALAVDVSFAKQPGLSQAGLGALGKGPMVGFAATLDREISQRLVVLAQNNNIAFQREAMGGKTGTNCDAIGTVHAGVPCALLSIPQRNMHTPGEVCDLMDIESTARLIVAYVQEDSYGS